MAHGSRSRRRDASDIANQRLPVSAPYRYVSSALPFGRFSSLRELEDRRTWHPSPGIFRPAITWSSPRRGFTTVDKVYGRSAGLQAAFRRQFPFAGSQTRATLSFAEPNRTAICVRRQQRREVLHALDRTQKGGAGKSNRWTEWSRVRCR